MTKDKKAKIYLLLAYILAACLLVYLWRPSYFLNIIIVYVPPSIITFYWLKKSRKKILIFAFVTTALFALPIELMARLADAWDVASIFPRMFDVAPVENLLYAFINFFWPLAFYEYFIDKDKEKNISTKWKYLIGLYCILSIAVYSLYIFNQKIIAVNYWLIGIFILIIPAILLFNHNKKLLKKIIVPTIFFGFVFFIHEIISLLIGHWWWPGQYLIPLNINGIIFPLDDVIIWYILSTPVLIGGYEFFVDNDR